jgi:NifB/MoaA-like Fe-S oxidoreductase
MQIYGPEDYFLMVEKDYSWYGPWVTPMADSITAMVDEVAEKLPGKLLAVYQATNGETVEESVDKVVKAVYEVLASRGIKYIENTGAASLGQRVNYPVETLRKKQGICIETVTLVASVLERLGLRTVMVFIPGHVFVGWHTNSEGEELDFFESTMLRDESLTYEKAKESAAKTFQEQVEAGNFETGDAVIVEINELRLKGIMPNNIP